jgi:hypothetical protein
MFMAIVNKISQMERQKEELLSETASAESEEKEDLEPLVVDNCLLR